MVARRRARLFAETDDARAGALGTFAVRRRALRLLGDFALRERLLEPLLERLFDERLLDALELLNVVLRPELGLRGVDALRRRRRAADFFGFRLDERERERLTLDEAELGAGRRGARAVRFRALRLRGVLRLREDDRETDGLGALGTDALRRLVRRAARRLADLRLRERELLFFGFKGPMGFFARFLFGAGDMARFFAARFLLYSSFSSWYFWYSAVFWYSITASWKAFFNSAALIVYGA